MSVKVSKQVAKEKIKLHGLTKYPFHELVEVGSHFTITKEQRYSIFSCLKNYNTKHNTGIKIKTKNIGGKIMVERV